MRRLELTGLTFGRLKVLRFAGIEKEQTMWLCKCNCGNTIKSKGHLLKRGAVKSCGCLRVDIGKVKNRTHGLSTTRLYQTWKDMISRCHNPVDTGYEKYGGAGIEVCDEWRNDILAFQRWALENGYKEGLTIDRKDNGKGYTPDNCRWATMKEQGNNQRRNVVIDVNGIKKTLAQWADETGINYATLWRRKSVGDTGEHLLRPVDKKYSHNRKRVEIEVQEVSQC